MVRLDEHLAEIRKAQEELDRCKDKKGPHYRDASRRLLKLRKERAEALRHMKAAGKI